MTKTAVTANEIRESLKADGYEAKISREGRVTYRRDGGLWLEGRWVEEYRRDHDGAIILV